MHVADKFIAGTSENFLDLVASKIRNLGLCFYATYRRRNSHRHRQRYRCRYMNRKGTGACDSCWPLIFAEFDDSRSRERDWAFIVLKRLVQHRKLPLLLLFL
jgi:hypothetical protein